MTGSASLETPKRHSTALDAREGPVVATLSSWDYSLVANVDGRDAYKARGQYLSVAVGRMSYVYILEGEWPLEFVVASVHGSDAYQPLGGASVWQRCQTPVHTSRVSNDTC